MLEMSNQWCTGTVLIVSWGSPGVKSLVFHYLWSLWDPLPKLLMRKNAKWHIIRFHHNYCSQNTPTKCNLALLRPLSCGVLGSCSNVGGPCRNIQSHQMNPMLEMSNQWCTGTVLIIFFLCMLDYAGDWLGIVGHQGQCHTATHLKNVSYNFWCCLTNVTYNFQVSKCFFSWIVPQKCKLHLSR